MRHTFEAHSNVPGFNFTCGVGGCPQTFKRYSAITSHLRRKHRGTDSNYPHITLYTQDDAYSLQCAGETTDEANVMMPQELLVLQLIIICQKRISLTALQLFFFYP